MVVSREDEGAGGGRRPILHRCSSFIDSNTRSRRRHHTSFECGDRFICVCLAPGSLKSSRAPAKGQRWLLAFSAFGSVCLFALLVPCFEFTRCGMYDE